MGSGLSERSGKTPLVGYREGKEVYRSLIDIIGETNIQYYFDKRFPKDNRPAPKYCYKNKKVRGNMTYYYFSAFDNLLFGMRKARSIKLVNGVVESISQQTFHYTSGTNSRNSSSYKYEYSHVNDDSFKLHIPKIALEEAEKLNLFYLRNSMIIKDGKQMFQVAVDNISQIATNAKVFVYLNDRLYNEVSVYFNSHDRKELIFTFDEIKEGDSVYIAVIPEEEEYNLSDNYESFISIQNESIIIEQNNPYLETLKVAKQLMGVLRNE